MIYQIFTIINGVGLFFILLIMLTCYSNLQDIIQVYSLINQDNIKYYKKIIEDKNNKSDELEAKNRLLINKLKKG